MDNKRFAKNLVKLNQCGTTQLRDMAKVMNIKNYSKLKRDDLIIAITTRAEELWSKQQMKLWE